MRKHEFRATELVPGWCVRCGEAPWTEVHGGDESNLAPICERVYDGCHLPLADGTCQRCGESAS